jgi:hypothetical protein
MVWPLALSWVSGLQGVFALKLIAVGDGAITEDDNRLLERFRLRQGEAQSGGV